MKLWIVMLLSSLLIPATICIAGWYYRGHTPKSKRSGYRTSRSLRSDETWAFAHRLLGKYWLRMGIPMLAVSIVIMLAVSGKSDQEIGTIGSTLCIAQSLAMLIPFIPIERALKQYFDENGVPYDPNDLNL